MRVFAGLQIQILQHSGRIQFKEIILTGVYQDILTLCFQSQLFFDGEIRQIFFHLSGIRSQKIRSAPKELFPRQIQVPLRGGFPKCEVQAAPDPKLRICPDANLSGNLIRDFKAHAPDVLRQPVRVFPQHLIQPVLILIIDFYAKAEGNSIL